MVSSAFDSTFSLLSSPNFPGPSMDSNLLRLIRFLVSFFRDRPSTSRFYGVVKRILATVQPLLQVFDCLGAFLRLGRTEATRSPHNDRPLDQQETPQGIIPQPSFTLVPNGEVITSHGAPCSIEPSVEGLYAVFMSFECFSYALSDPSSSMDASPLPEAIEVTQSPPNPLFVQPTGVDISHIHSERPLWFVKTRYKRRPWYSLSFFLCILAMQFKI